MTGLLGGACGVLGTSLGCVTTDASATLRSHRSAFAELDDCLSVGLEQQQRLQTKP